MSCTLRQSDVESRRTSALLARAGMAPTGDEGSRRGRGRAICDGCAADVIKTLLVSCQAMRRYSGAADVAERLLAIVRDGLANRST